MRAVLAVLALAIPGSVAAVSVSEGPDFGNTFATRTVLPAATDEIAGTVFNDFFMTFDSDYAAFTDLVPGATFTVIDVMSFGPFNFPLRILDSTNSLVVPVVSLPLGHVGFPPIVVATGIVPLSGELVFHLASADLGSSYRLQLDAPRIVPEPGTALLIAFGLAALARARRSVRS